jgi:hypothetical protein
MLLAGTIEKDVYGPKYAVLIEKQEQPSSEQ